MINSNEKKKSLIQVLRNIFLDSDQEKENQVCGCNTPPKATQNCRCCTPPSPPTCGCGSANQVSSCCSSSVNETFNSIAQRFGKKKADSSCGCGSIYTVGPEEITKMSQEELTYYRAYEQINPKVFKNLDDLFSYKKFGKVPSPTFISIDPTNICNLECPLCFYGQKKANYKKGVMSFSTFKTVVDKIPTLESIALFSFGESFLNPEIFEMIKYSSQKGIMTSIHSNFSFNKNNEFFTNIVQSGLCSLVLSIDGASQDSYSAYRKVVTLILLFQIYVC
ncbi:radical SAM protein [Ruminiclostridium josui]|uniref:radical SAM protein n=1 Tax=Ruminiclostridium josui TaxID=1499 RepID=UPI0006D2453C|nr:radical SAM protein [Ruminiclostridium josui]